MSGYAAEDSLNSDSRVEVEARYKLRARGRNWCTRKSHRKVVNSKQDAIVTNYLTLQVGTTVKETSVPNLSWSSVRDRAFPLSMRRRVERRKTQSFTLLRFTHYLRARGCSDRVCSLLVASKPRGSVRDHHRWRSRSARQSALSQLREKEKKKNEGASRNSAGCTGEADQSPKASFAKCGRKREPFRNLSKTRARASICLGRVRKSGAVWKSTSQSDVSGLPPFFFLFFL